MFFFFKMALIKPDASKLNKLKVTPFGNFVYFFMELMSRDSAVGIATGYGMDDQGVRVQVPVGQEFSLLHVV
jgi:hypothetical protein